MSLCVDVNCDMGESFGSYAIGNDEEVARHITSSNVACGFHASDPRTMALTVGLCRRHGVRVGAHPGYPDMLGFGRRFMNVGDDELIHYVTYQVGALYGFLGAEGLTLQHVKLHGALYNYMIKREDLFLRMARRLVSVFGDVVFLTLGSSGAAGLRSRCVEEGIRCAFEAFPDRHYTDDGELLSRSDAGAVIRDPVLIAERALEMVARKGIKSVNGRWIPMEVDTVCIHGDSRDCVEAAGEIRSRAAKEGIEIKPLGTFV